MGLKEKLQNDLKEALKAGDQFKVGVLRLTNAAIQNKEIEGRAKGKTELSQDEIMAVLQSEAKKRRDSIEAFSSGGRADLASKEEAELKVIKNYLPPELDSSEIEARVKELLAGRDFKDFGSTMKAVMAELKGKADAKIVSEIVRKLVAR